MELAGIDVPVEPVQTTIAARRQPTGRSTACSPPARRRAGPRRRCAHWREALADYMVARGLRA